MIDRCPNGVTLQAFHHGRLSDGEVCKLAQHIERCRVCEASLDQLEREADDVVMALRDTGTASTWNGRGHKATVEMRVPNVPGYEILGEAGRGGMGVVYKARQSGLDRSVALKVVLNGAYARPEALARLRREAKAAASVRHVNVVQVYEVGDHDGLPYLAMEWVDGGTLDVKLGGRALPARDAARLLAAIARGVHHAHEHNVIHRDLKPANILLQVKDGNGVDWPLTAIPKVSDFGLAYRTDRNERLTASGVLAGSPSYMSPEQTRGDGSSGALADIYALGAILYECLTGRPPFLGDNAADTLLRVREDEPVAPHHIVKNVPRDLETVCLKCLAKVPTQRYQTGAELADDLQCFLDGRPVRARRTPVTTRAWLWAKRRPALASALSALILVTVVGFFLVLSQWRIAQRRANSEAEARLAGQRLTSKLTLEQGLSQCSQGDYSAGLATILNACEIATAAKDEALERVARVNLSAWRQFFNREIYKCQHGDWVQDARFNRDYSVLLTASADRTVRRWHGKQGHPLSAPLMHDHRVHCAVFSPDERLILSGGGTEDRKSGAAWLWDTGDDQVLAKLPHPSPVTFLAFSKDGRSFVTVCSKWIQLWSTETREPIGPRLEHGSGEIQFATMSSDGRCLLTGGTDKTARLWDITNHKQIGEPMTHDEEVQVTAISPDDQVLLTGDKLGKVQLWLRSTGTKLGPPMHHNGMVRAVAFSPDCQYLATGSVVEVYDAQSNTRRRPAGETRMYRARTGADWAEQSLGKPLCTPRAVRWPIWSVAFSPDSRRILAGSGEGLVRLYDTVSGQQIGNPLFAGGTVKTVHFLPDGSTAMTATMGTTARLWDLSAQQLNESPLFSDLKPTAMAYSPDGSILAVDGLASGQLLLWDGVNERMIKTSADQSEAIKNIVWHPNGKELATISISTGTVRFWNVPEGTCERTWTQAGFVRGFAYLDDGRTIVTATREGIVQCWNAESLTPTGISFQTDGVISAAINAHDRSIFVATYEKPVRHWDISTGKLLQTFAHPVWSASCVVSPDGKLLLTGSAFDRIAQLWDVRTGKTIVKPLTQANGGQSALAFSSDGRTVATGNSDQTIQLWDVATGQPLGPPCPLGANPREVVFSADGRKVIAAGEAGLRIWVVPVPMTGAISDLRESLAETHPSP